MILKELEAHHFRNIESCKIAFEKGVNILIGENAQGKTNALEAIYYFSRGKSFRSVPDENMMALNSSYFETQIRFQNREREQVLRFEYEKPSKRKRFRNGVEIKKVSEMIGHFRAILFYPEHLQIIKGSPADRREFLNIAISSQDPHYIDLYSKYVNILENRNCLLKQAQKGQYFDLSELEAWSYQLSYYAAQIYMRRYTYVKGIEPFVKVIMEDLTSQRENISLEYVSQIHEENIEDAEKAFQKLFTENIKKECFNGSSLYGIQRDDLSILIKDLSSRSYASQGQQRSAVLALKLAEGEYSKKITEEYPVFLFDDVLSELDERRKEYVLTQMGERQLILTTCEKLKKQDDYYQIVVEGGSYVSSYR